MSRGRGSGAVPSGETETAIAWATVRRLLAVRLDTIGDVLMTTPAIRALKESGPGREITVLASPAGADAAALVPEVDDVIVYPAPWMKASPTGGDGRGDRSMIERLRRARFDAVVIFTVYSQSPLPAALLCTLADIPRRLAHCRENPYRLLTHWVPEPEPERFVRHEVRRQLDLVSLVNARTGDERLSLRVPGPARRRVRSLLDELGIDPSGRWCVIHPGATAPSRRYPPEHFTAVADRLAGEAACRIVFTGSAEERSLVGSVQLAMESASSSVAGRLDLGELAALLELAPVLISNNSGPVHVAAAVGTPVVDLYALTNPQHTPWGVPNRVLSHDVPCRWCYQSICPEGHHACLRLVRPDAVYEAACELMSIQGPDIRPATFQPSGP
jgi:lipopolysaccharide heptosyltransferase II